MAIAIAGVAMLAVLLLMLGEAVLAAHNERVLRARGAVEAAGDVYGTMRWAYPACFVVMAWEGAVRGPSPPDALALGLATWGLAKALKIWAIGTLGVRWTFRVLTLPGAPLVTSGPYAWLRHPNYLAVLGELAGMALIVWAPAGGVLSLLGFGALMRRRTAVEDRALGRQLPPRMSERPPALPRLVRLIDAVTVVLAVLALNVALTGGFRESMLFGRLSVTSWVRPLVIAIVLAGIRHWLRPQPTLAARVRTAVTRVWNSAEVRAVWPLALGTRLGVFVVGFLAIGLIGFRPDFAVPWRIYENEVLNLPARWDTGWYLGVASEGYTWAPSRATSQQNIAFFPVYPMLMRYGSLLLGRELMWTGVLISWLSFWGALVYLFRLARARLGEDAASPAIALLACYPFAFFFSTAYTESLFLLTVVASCYHFERGELRASAVWGLAAGLTRPNGCLLSVALGLMALGPLWPRGWHYWRPTLPPVGGWSRLADRLAAAAAPGIGMLIYSTYVFFLTGNPLQWAVQNAAWGRVYRGLDALVAQQAQRIGDHGVYAYVNTRPIEAVQLAAVLFALASVWPVARRLGLAYAAFILVNLLPPLMMGGLLSMGRVTAVLFPTFLWLGAAIPAAHRTAWLVVFAMLQALGAAIFFTWRPLY